MIDGSLSKLLSAIEETPSLDILFFDSITVDEVSGKLISGIKYHNNESNLISGEQYLTTQSVPWVPWMALYRKEFLLHNAIRFAEKVRFEDADYVLKSTLLAKKVRYISIPVIKYMISSFSTTNIGNDRNKIEERLKSADRLYNLANQYRESYPCGSEIIRGHYKFKYKSIIMRNLWRVGHSSIVELLSQYPYRDSTSKDQLITFASKSPRLYALSASICRPFLKFMLKLRFK